jgi:hypothetical protein
MTRVLFVLLTAGWIGCAVEPATPAAETEPAASTLQEVSVLESDPAPQFAACKAGATCVRDDDCIGEPSNLTCGAGKHCCNPVGCAGFCGPPTACTAVNEYIDPGAICPNGGKCCVMTGIE